MTFPNNALLEEVVEKVFRSESLTIAFILEPKLVSVLKSCGLNTKKQGI